SGVIVASVHPGLAGRDEASSRRFFDTLGGKIRGMPGGDAGSSGGPVALSLNIPVNRFRAHTDPARARRDLPFVDTAIVGPDYFRAVHIPLVAGREFSRTDDATHPRVAVINETMAKQHWRDGNPLGRRIAVGFPEPLSVEIVGVVRDTKSR